MTWFGDVRRRMRGGAGRDEGERHDAGPGKGPVPRDGGGSTPQIVVMSRTGCHLCVQAETLVAAVASRRGLPWRRVDVDVELDPARRACYSDLVPVVEVDGVEVARWRLDVGALEAALDRRGA